MSHDDFAVEGVRGLPARPPEGERLLWQGAPDWRMLARHALGLRVVVLYFAALAAWRALAVGADHGTGAALATIPVNLSLCAGVAAIIAATAWGMAKSTVYTITTHRVALRVGMALTVTLNLPYRWIGSAELRLHPGGTGDIFLATSGETRLSYLVLWPHVRPWRMGRTQPAFRCIPEAARVAALLGEAAATRVTEIRREDHAARPIAAE